MYESHYVSLFFRLWGATERADGISPEHSLLGNAQNPFDELLGDVAGQAGHRFFLIEFKRDRAGIANEVAPNGKAHRHALYQHLRADQRCRELARFGHLAAYVDASSNKLAFETYAHAAAPMTARPRREEAGEQASPRPDELDHWVGCIDFSKLHPYLTHPSPEPHETVPGAFASGGGLTKEGLSEYIACMYQHLRKGTDTDGQAVLGVYDPETKSLRSFHGTPTELIYRLHFAFAQMSKQVAEEKSASRRRVPGVK